MRKLKMAAAAALCMAAMTFTFNTKEAFAKEYINGVLVQESDYEDPDYIKYVSNIDKVNETENEESDEKTQLIKSAFTKVMDTPLARLAVEYVSKTKSIFNGNFYYHDEKFKDAEILEGIDVSKWQGDIDWKKVKAAGVDFAIIRVGYRSSSSGNIAIDSKFKQNIEGAKEAGIEHIGVYMFSQAITYAEAKEEAKAVLNWIKDYEINMPIVIDAEYVSGGRYDKNIKKEVKTRICETFCDTVIAAGYDAMIYSSKSFLQNDPDGLNGSYLSEKYGIWVAQWSNKNTYDYDYQFWQYGGDPNGGRVDGIKGIIDTDYWYVTDPMYIYEPTGSVGLSEKTFAMNVGDSKTIKAEVSEEILEQFKDYEDAGKVKWHSENPAVAYVDLTGKVVAVSNGKTKIIATAKNGVKASCNVTVYNKMNSYVINTVSSAVYTGKEITNAVSVTSKEKIAYSGTAIMDYVQIRRGPANSFKAVKTLYKNDKFKVLQKITVNDKIWYAVIHTDEDGNIYEGYVPGGVNGTEFVSIRESKKTLVEGLDYKVIYSNNKYPGTATVKVAGLTSNKFKGSISKNFTIKPKKPENITSESKGTDTQILKFTKVPLASGYNIYRSESLDGTYKKIKYVNKFTYTDKGLEQGKFYYYKITAVKKIGNKTYESDFSDAVTTYIANTKYSNSKVIKNTYLYQSAGATYKKLCKVEKDYVFKKIIAQSKDVNGKTWYYVYIKTGNKSYKGFINSSCLDYSKKGKVTATTLNVRKGPSTSNGLIRVIKKNTTVNITEEVNGWYKVNFTLGGKKFEGYVNKKYIKLV